MSTVQTNLSSFLKPEATEIPIEQYCTSHNDWEALELVCLVCKLVLQMMKLSPEHFKRHLAFVLLLPWDTQR